MASLACGSHWPSNKDSADTSAFVPYPPYPSSESIAIGSPIAGEKAPSRLCSWTPDESQVESCEHQDNANIDCQPFPESVSEKHEIYNDYDGCHHHHVKHNGYLSPHSRKTSIPAWINQAPNKSPRLSSAEHRLAPALNQGMTSRSWGIGDADLGTGSTCAPDRVFSALFS
jgi:hypothetical protein